MSDTLFLLTFPLSLPHLSSSFYSSVSYNFSFLQGLSLKLYAAPCPAHPLRPSLLVGGAPLLRAPPTSSAGAVWSRLWRLPMTAAASGLLGQRSTATQRRSRSTTSLPPPSLTASPAPPCPALSCHCRPALPRPDTVLSLSFVLSYLLWWLGEETERKLGKHIEDANGSGDFILMTPTTLVKRNAFIAHDSGCSYDSRLCAMCIVHSHDSIIVSMSSVTVN